MNCERRNAELEDAPPGIWRRTISTPEGKVFIAGVIVTCLYMAAILLAGQGSRSLLRVLFTMTGAHIVGGRAAGMSFGYAHGLAPGVVIITNMAIETFAVLLFYPLFVLSYQKLIVIKPLKETMERTQRTAKALQPKIMKYGIPGLMVFVWFPFWMTGPLVGCIIGFLIGLRLWVNLSVVLGGTYLAIVCWGLILERVHESLSSLGPYVPFAFVGLILLFSVALRVRYAFSQHARQKDVSSRGTSENEGEEPTEL